MTPLATLLVRVGWSARELASRVGVNERTAQRWVVGSTPCPAEIVRWLGGLADFIEGNPPPVSWHFPPDQSR
jgi:hypothetical protein